MIAAPTNPEETEPVDRDPIAWVNNQQRVRLVEAHTGRTEYATGVVYAYCDAPSIAIRTDDGREVHWRADLAEPVPDPVSTEDTDLRRAMSAAMEQADSAWGIGAPGVAGFTDAALSVVRPRLDAKDKEIETLQGRLSYTQRERDDWIRTYEGVRNGLRKTQAERDAALADAAKWSKAAQAAGDHCRQVERERDGIKVELLNTREELRIANDWHAEIAAELRMPDGSLLADVKRRAAELVDSSVAGEIDGAELRAEVEQLRGDLKKAHTYIGERLIAGFAAAPVSSVEPEQPTAEEFAKFDDALKSCRGPAASPSPVEAQPTTRTLTVSWHPDAIQRAIDHAKQVLDSTVDPDASVVGPLTWMDLACLVDAGEWIADQQEQPAVPDQAQPRPWESLHWGAFLRFEPRADGSTSVSVGDDTGQTTKTTVMSGDLEALRDWLTEVVEAGRACVGPAGRSEQPRYQARKRAAAAPSTSQQGDGQ